jgi:DNA-binding MarR family transcriptional regulator
MATPTRLPRESSAVKVARSIHLNVILLANRSLNQFQEICEEYGLTHQQYVALWILCLSDGAERGLPTGAVADGLLTPASDVTRLIDRLEKAGLVERLPNPADRRGVLVRATTRGRDVFEQVTPHIQEFHRRQWDNLTAPEVDALNVLLLKALWGQDFAEAK